MLRRVFRRVLSTSFVLACLPLNTAKAELTSQQLLLIVNRNAPEGRELAAFYQRARQVPEGRVLELDLPVGDRMARHQYEQVVVPAVRQFLLDNGLRDQVRCAVTFYGVPLIVEAKRLTEAERLELAQVNREAAEVAAKLEPLAREAERVASLVGFRGPPWRKGDGEKIPPLLARVAAAEASLTPQSTKALTEAQRQSLASRASALRAKFDQPFAPGEGGALKRDEIADLMGRTDEESRRQLRGLFQTRGSLRSYAELLVQQQRWLSEEQSDACFDSELAALWIDNAPASGWLVNPLARGGDDPSAQRQTVLMVSRLDGRDPQQVRDLVTTSVQVEQNGLRGKIVVDSRGIAAPGPHGAHDGYGVFDEQLRRLARQLQTNATLPVVHDDRADVIQPPGQTDVAVYVGWYSLAKYVPAFGFARGAVGYHVASFEMRSLRDPNLLGWVRGLLDDGVTATMGPVSEPYLVAFPPPEEFVPLLLTGELTLAEVYWRTVPLMSWKLGLVGDPLYRPFAAAAALPAESLTPALRQRLDG